MAKIELGADVVREHVGHTAAGQTVRRDIERIDGPDGARTASARHIMASRKCRFRFLAEEPDFSVQDADGDRLSRCDLARCTPRSEFAIYIFYIYWLHKRHIFYTLIWRMLHLLGSRRHWSSALI
jgi:hypothetical protein